MPIPPTPDLDAHGLLTPALVIDLDAVRANVRTTIQRVGLDRWRPHVKTSKVPEVLDELLGAGVRRFKCATPREARVLLERAAAGGAGPVDLLVAFAHRGPNLDRLGELARAFPDGAVHVLTEDPDHAGLLAERGFGIFVDVDPGYRRSGIPLAEDDRIARCIDAAGPGLRGIQAYDGHLTMADPAARAAACDALYPRVADLARRLLGPDHELLTSGTPTFAQAVEHPAFAPFGSRHRVGPGTVVYWDLRSEELGIPGYRFAARVVGRVVARPDDRSFTVDAGSKAVDAAVESPVAAVVDAHASPSWRARRPSEEHLPFDAPDGDAPPLGRLLSLVPHHVCPTVNLADQAALRHPDGRLDVVAVSARSHELAPDRIRSAASGT